MAMKGNVKHYREGGPRKNEGKKALVGEKPRWMADGSNCEQTKPKKLRMVEEDSGRQSHPHKMSQPRTMRFLGGRE